MPVSLQTLKSYVDNGGKVKRNSDFKVFTVKSNTGGEYDLVADDGERISGIKAYNDERVVNNQLQGFYSGGRRRRAGKKSRKARKSRSRKSRRVRR